MLSQNRNAEEASRSRVKKEFVANLLKQEHSGNLYGLLRDIS
jgi:hypothetical protein